jgi:hypothetical protein
MKFLFFVTARHKVTGKPFCGEAIAETANGAFSVLCHRWGYAEEDCIFRASVQYDEQPQAN